MHRTPPSFLVVALFIVALLGSAAWWECFKFSECRQVGHSELFCILSIGR